MGLFHRFGIVHLPDPLQVLAHPLVVGVAITLYVVEFVADKIPFVDSVWDAVHTAIRPPAAAVISYSAFANFPETWRIAAALLGGGVALTSHSTKASTRAAANASSEPLSNWLLSLTEDGVSDSCGGGGGFGIRRLEALPISAAGTRAAPTRRAERAARVSRLFAAHVARRTLHAAPSAPHYPNLALTFPPTPNPSLRAAEPPRTAISTAPPEPTYATSPP